MEDSDTTMYTLDDKESRNWVKFGLNVELKSLQSGKVADRFGGRYEVPGERHGTRLLP